MKMFHGNQLERAADSHGFQFPNFENATIKFRRIESSFEWHENEGQELFMVLDGELQMLVREFGSTDERVEFMAAGDIMLLEKGDSHVARPNGSVKVMFVETVLLETRAKQSVKCRAEPVR
ncbi:hypothetical protein SAMN06297468_0823 [Altererythrobacter xiamenensis]|uniref:Mannose-6-phosphate isomerase, cupin superfamily n=1 Tax=Altererythrobacter xiamenensis TaxID=1316679 RepID=A0A1Y6EKW1_9SPHN|nr:hypothetical protein [Altererythrobacter xiamenensis]SMQ63227.1 hypothetical protein SAMN06297468_0823 [Altererythrobacter xiamenensis]